MADVVKYVEIITKVTEKLKSKFNCKIYADEVLENFKKPCFFIKLESINAQQTINFTQKNVSVILTYFPADNQRNEIHYLDIFDKIESIFQCGLQLQERYMHTDNISTDRVGEDMDILQISIDFAYLEKIPSQKPAAELLEEVELHMKVNEREVI